MEENLRKKFIFQRFFLQNRLVYLKNASQLTCFEKFVNYILQNRPPAYLRNIFDHLTIQLREKPNKR